MLNGGGAALGSNPLLRSTWYPALQAAVGARAVISFIGDSITEGHASTDFDATDFVSLTRDSLQTLYGNGGEGFISPVHTSDPLEVGWAASPTTRWSFASGTWSLYHASSRAGWGAIGGAAYWADNTIIPQITFTGDSIQIMTGIKIVFSPAKNLIVKVDGDIVDTIDEAGGFNGLSQFAPGTVYYLHRSWSWGACSHT